MNQAQIKDKIKIALSLLGSSRTDGYGNGRMTHLNRNFVTRSVMELLEEVVFKLDQDVVLIIPNSSPNINPPDES
jgi:hypothetical protein